MIADLYGGGPVGIETRAAGLSEARDTLEDVVEPFLIQQGLVARTARGRVPVSYTHLDVYKRQEEKRGLADDIKDVYSEAKANGYDVKTMRAIVRLRKMDANARAEMEALLDTYRAALNV